MILSRSLSIMCAAITLAGVLVSPARAALLPPSTFDDFDISGIPGFSTPIRISNLGSVAAEVVLTPASGPVQGAVQQGFQLLDRSLTAAITGVSKGEIRARYGIRMDGRRLRRLGIRASQLRLMQFDARARRWVRASRLLARDQVRVRFVRAAPRFALGTFGVDPQTNLVWGVTNSGGQFAVAARLTQVAAPASMTLLALGLAAGLLGLGVSRRRHV